MVHKIVSITVVVLIVVMTGCATSPTTSTPTATTQPKAPAATPKPAASPAAAEPSGTLTSAISTFGDDALDPIFFSAVQLTTPMFEFLAEFNDKGKLVPLIAESWALSQDGLVWTFQIRKGLKFHNGDEVTAADVKFSIERIISPKGRTAWSTVLRNVISRVDAPDTYTVAVTTKQVDANFVYTTPGILVVPKKYTEEKGDDYVAKNPVGTGPWKFAKHTPSSSLELEAVKGHWRVTPAFQTLVIKLVPEESTRMAMLKRGEVDITEISLDRVDEVKSAGLDLRFGFYTSEPEVLLPGTWMQTGQPVMDIRVRQALSLAINRDEMGKTFFKGFATPGRMRHMADYSWAWDPAWTADPYDAKKAKDLLAEAGYPSKFKDPVINMYAYQAAGAGWLAQWMQIISGYWEAIGVKTKITAIDQAAMRAMYAVRPPDPKLVGAVYPFTGGASPNTVYHAWNSYGSTGIAALMEDPEWDDIYGKVLKERDEAKRVQLFREAMNRGHDLYVDIQTVNVKMTYAVGNRVGEWRTLVSSLGRAYEGVQHK